MTQDEGQIILNEATHQIKDLIKKHKWADAHRACLEILRFDPDNLKVLRLKASIERKVKRINIKAIKDDLEKIKPLIKEKKYTEILVHLKTLAPYENDYYPLRKLTRKIEKLYLDQIRGQTKDQNSADLEKTYELLKNNKYQEAIRTAQKLRILKFNESKIKQLISKIKKNWINYELKQSKTLLESEKFEDILLNLQRIKKIDPKSIKIEKLINSINKKYQQFKIMEKKDFIYRGLEKTRTLIQLKKYEKAIIALDEILNIDPSNNKAKYMKVLAARKFSRNINKEVETQMKTTHNQNSREYKKDKSRFIKI